MCGIVGLFLKTKALEPQLGQLMSGMLAAMCNRGPDSAGFAVYGLGQEGANKITVQADDPDLSFENLAEAISQEIGAKVNFERRSTHGVLSVASGDVEQTRIAMRERHPNLRVVGIGEVMEIYKEVGLPTDVARRFGLEGMHGTHGIGHTRMATESAVTTLGAHPFSTGNDQCLVHNGSLSNHNNLRRKLARDGMRFETENDSEVAAAYLTWRMDQGLDLGAALEKSVEELDGFYTFVVGTKEGFGILRDPVACKPAVLAETEDFVAFGSEFRALVGLPGIDKAHVWEPEPAMVYFWEH